jgi:hypothetical protein
LSLLAANSSCWLRNARALFPSTEIVPAVHGRQRTAHPVLIHLSALCNCKVHDNGDLSGVPSEAYKPPEASTEEEEDCDILHGMPSPETKGNQLQPTPLLALTNASAIAHHHARIVLPETSSPFASTKTNLRESNNCWRRVQTGRPGMAGYTASSNRQSPIQQHSK